MARNNDGFDRTSERVKTENLFSVFRATRNGRLLRSKRLVPPGSPTGSLKENSGSRRKLNGDLYLKNHPFLCINFSMRKNFVVSKKLKFYLSFLLASLFYRGSKPYFWPKCPFRRDLLFLTLIHEFSEFENFSMVMRNFSGFLILASICFSSGVVAAL